MNFHPEIDSLMSYAAGAVGEPFAVLIAAHAETCAQCRGHLNALNALGGALVCEELGVAGGEIARMMSRLDESEAAADLLPPRASGNWPGALARLIGGDAGAVAWRSAGPGLEMHRRVFATPAGEQALRFVRATPGAAIPAHSHPGNEMTLVLEGELVDGDRRLGPGDVCEHANDVWHAPSVAGERPCVCVIAEEGPPILTRR